MIHHVQLAAPSGSDSSARAFWVGLLGFEEDFRPARKAHPGLLLEDLDAWVGRLWAAGYQMSCDAGFPGMRRFYTADPFGNRLEFLEQAGTLPGQ